MIKKAELLVGMKARGLGWRPVDDCVTVAGVDQVKRGFPQMKFPSRRRKSTKQGRQVFQLP